MLGLTVDKEINEELIAVKNALKWSTPPPLGPILCRNMQQSIIQDFVLKNLGNGTSDNLYVCGSPGTGKTLTVERVLQTLQNKEKNPFTIHWINAMSFGTHLNSFYPSLLADIERQDHSSSSSSVISLHIEPNTKQTNENSKLAKKRLFDMVRFVFISVYK